MTKRSPKRYSLALARRFSSANIVGMKKISTIAAAIATSLVLATTLSACGGDKDHKDAEDQSGVVAEQSADKDADDKKVDEKDADDKDAADKDADEKEAEDAS